MCTYKKVRDVLALTTGREDLQAAVPNFYFTFQEEFCGWRRCFGLPGLHPCWNLLEDLSLSDQLSTVPP